jgi:hypothetical protein
MCLVLYLFCVELVYLMHFYCILKRNDFRRISVSPERASVTDYGMVFRAKQSCGSVLALNRTQYHFSYQIFPEPNA